MPKLLLLCLLFPFLSTAQPKISRTETVPTNLDTEVIGLSLEPNTDNILVFNEVYLEPNFAHLKSKYQWTVDVFTPDLKRISKGQPEKILFPNGDRAKACIVASLGGVPKMLSCQYEKKDKKLRIYGATVEQGGKINSPTLLGSLDGNLPEDELMPICTYDAENASLLMMMPTGKTKKGHNISILDGGEQISCLVLDRNWKVVREEVMTLPGAETSYLFGKALIHSDGSIWMPVWTQEVKTSMPQEIWVWESGKPEMTRIDISLTPQFLITSLKLHRVGDLIYAGGLYTVQDKKAQKAMFNPPYPTVHVDRPTQGTFLIKIDQNTRKVLSKTNDRFTEPVLKFWETTKADLDKGGGLNNIVLQNIGQMPDGGAWLCLEYYYYEPIVMSSTTTKGYYGGNYFHGTAMLAQYDSESKLVQEFKLGKGLYAYSPVYSGYFFANNAKNVLMLYNDHKANLDQSNKVFYKIVTNSLRGKPHAAIYYSGYKDGAVKPQELFKDEEKGALIRPHIYIEVAPGSFIFPYEGSTGWGLVKVEM